MFAHYFTDARVFIHYSLFSAMISNRIHTYFIPRVCLSINLFTMILHLNKTNNLISTMAMGVRVL